MTISLPRISEIVPACLLAGCGMVCAGSFLDWVKVHYSDDFDPLLLTIIPPLIGLKGNLEVTLSSRLSTLVNLRTEVNRYTVEFFCSTLLYTLFQGVSSAVVISVLCWSLHTTLSTPSSQLGLVNLGIISCLTCSLAICALSILLFLLIVGCLKFGVNPDHIGPPVAAALGDLGTVSILWFIHRCSLHSSLVLALTLCLLVLGANAYFWGHASNSADLHGLTLTPSSLVSSIAPLLGAVTMSSLSGQILARFADVPNLTRLQIAINGVGGCFGSIVVSRLITSIHAHHSPHRTRSPLGSPMLSVESTDNTKVNSPVFALDDHHQRHVVVLTTEPSSPSVHHYLPDEQRSVVAQVGHEADIVSKLILCACVPVHLGLVLLSSMLLWFLPNTSHPNPQLFRLGTVFAYILAGFFQVWVVLKFAKWIVLTSWHQLTCSGHVLPQCYCVWPSNVSPPSLASLDLIGIALTTGLGDFVGSVLLTVALSSLQFNDV